MQRLTGRKLWSEMLSCDECMIKMQTLVCQSMIYKIFLYFIYKYVMVSYVYKDYYYYYVCTDFRGI